MLLRYPPSFPRHPSPRLASSPRHAPRHNESPGLCVAVELNLKGPPYPKRAHSRRCIHLVGRKGDQKLNSYLEVFATGLSFPCMRVRVCVCSFSRAHMCTCVHARSTSAFDSSVEFYGLDRYVRACNNTVVREYTCIHVSGGAWFLSSLFFFFLFRRNYYLPRFEVEIIYFFIS